MKRSGLVFLTIFLLLAVLGGILPVLGAQKKLTVLMALGEDEWKVMRAAILPPFEKEYGCRVEAYQVESSDAIRKLEAMAAAKKMEVDLITQDNMLLAQLVEKGLVEDLSEYRELIPETILKSLLPVGEFRGKLYFLPYRPNVEIAYYNETKFKKYGLQPPKNWDELLVVAKTFKEKEGIGRVAIKADLSSCTTVHLFDFIRQAGGDPMKLNDAGCVRAFTFLQQLWPYCSPDSKKANWNYMNRFLATDSVYLGWNWPFGVNVIVKDGKKEEIKAYAGWAGPVKASHVLGGEVIGIPVGSPHRALAVKFAEYLLSREVQEKLVSQMGWPACRSDAYGKVEKWQQPYFAAVNAALETAEPRPNVTYWADFEKIILKAFRLSVLEGQPVKATLDAAAAELAPLKK
ncbi:MAG: extracellular solute-binding protein [Bacteroidota bacterium]